MKYIRKNKDGIITESVEKDLFTLAHEAMGDWELVSNKECEDCLKAIPSILLAKEAEKQAKNATSKEFREKKKEERRTREADFEEFKAWKASRGTK